jgi:hypothetical protein
LTSPGDIPDDGSARWTALITAPTIGFEIRGFEIRGSEIRERLLDNPR